MNIRSLLSSARSGWTALLAAAALGAAASSAGAAVTFYFAPVSQSVLLGGSSTFEVRATVTGPPGAIGAYDLSIAYNPAIVQVDSLVFGSGLDLGTLGDSDQSLSSFGAGLISLVEISFVDAADLVAGQPGDFALATVGFTGLSVGVSPLTIISNGVSDENGFEVASTSVTTSTGSIEVFTGGTTVPETMGVMPAILTFGLVLYLGGRAARKTRRMPA